MNFADKVDAILESCVLHENPRYSTYLDDGVTFSDLKKIYLAHEAGREPDKMTLNKVSEVLVRFLTGEVERTEKWLVSGEDMPPEWPPRIQKMIDEYVTVRDGLDKAYQTADYRKMWIYIDHVINLHHWYSTVWDNLSFMLGPYGRELQKELSRFLESIGRFPRSAKEGESWDDVMKQTWQFGPDGERVPYKDEEH